MRNRAHADSSLECFGSSPLYRMVVGICAENADVIEVLVAVGWWWVLVCAELIASTGDAGVNEAGLGVVVVAELGRTAVAPWVIFHISWVGLSVVCTWWEGCVRDWSKLAAVLVLGLVARLQVWRSVRSQVL